MICPACSSELDHDQIGGDQSNGRRPALLCGKCWTVFPNRPPRLVVVTEPEPRKDLA